MTASTVLFDRRLLVRRRDRAAAGAHAHDFLLRRVADDLLERLAVVKRSFPVMLDLGAHHGLLSRRLRSLSGIDIVVSAERAPRLLEQCPMPRVLCDEEALPFREGSLDLVVSGLALQHVNDLPGVLVQINRALKPDGLLLAAMLGGATLTELRQSFVAAEDETAGGASPRVAPFADVRDLGALLQRAGFALPVVDSDTVTVTYSSPLHLMRELRAMGASNALAERHRRPLARATLFRAVEIYHERFGRPDGRVPATFEIMTLTGWAPHESQQQPLRPGTARTRLADALGVEEQSAGETSGGDSPGGGD
jgi:SAM-dependent methyltransferase